MNINTTKKYKYILWDMDDTLTDFKRSESLSLHQCFASYDITLSAKDIDAYSEINHQHWSLLERGEIDKSTMLVRRFEKFREYLGNPNIDSAKINHNYQLALGDNVILYPNAFDICQNLKIHYQQYIITNGTAIAQDKKLVNSGLIDIMDDAFISDRVGYEKPDIRFFNQCAAHIPNFQKEDALLIGDSLTSDMQGANNFGIDCCWFNPNAKAMPTNLSINYVISSLIELYNFL